MATFTVPASKRSIAQNQFAFNLEEGGPSYSLPLLRYLPVGVVAELEALAQPGLADVLRLFGDTEALTAVKTLDAEQMGALMTAWQDASGVTLPN